MRYSYCYDAHGNIIDHFTQYDRRQTVFIYIGSESDDTLYKSDIKFLFSNDNSTESIEIEALSMGLNTVSAIIPDSLLEEALPLIGNVYATSTDSEDSKKTVATFKVPVRPMAIPSSYLPISCESVSLSTNYISALAVGRTYTLTATVTPSDTTDEIRWSSSDNTVATVSDGVVTGVSPSYFYTGTCNTTSDTILKEITITGPYSTSGWGIFAAVTFTYAHTATAGVYFKIKWVDSNNSNTTEATQSTTKISQQIWTWEAGETLCFRFDSATECTKVKRSQIDSTVITVTCGTRFDNCNVIVVS